MESEICDVCATTEKGTRVSAAGIRSAAKNGFDPDRLQLLPKPPGMSNPSLARAMWQMLLRDSESDWNLCARCMAAVKPYLPEPVQVVAPAPVQPPAAAARVQTPEIAAPERTGLESMPQLVPALVSEPVQSPAAAPQVQAAVAAVLEPGGQESVSELLPADRSEPAPPPAAVPLARMAEAAPEERTFHEAPPEPVQFVRPEPAVTPRAAPQDRAAQAVPQVRSATGGPRTSPGRDLLSELRQCEDLFFFFKFPELVELSSTLIGRFPESADAYAYRCFALLGEGRAGSQEGEADNLDDLLRDYFRACEGSLATEGATVCRLFLKLIFTDLVKRMRQSELGAKVSLQKTDPLCGGAFAMLEGDFDKAQARFDRALSDPASSAYAFAGIGLLKVFQSDLHGALHAFTNAGTNDKDIVALARSFARDVQIADDSHEVSKAPPEIPPPPVFQGDAEQLARVLEVLDKIASYRDKQFELAGAKRGRDGKWETFPNAGQVMQKCLQQADRLWGLEFPVLSKRLQLQGADLSQREFFGLRRTLAMQKSDLRHAQLRDTAWCQINLDKADFSSAGLRGARFIGVQCEQTSFRSADLSGAELDFASTTYPIDLSGANLTGATIQFGRFFIHGVESYTPVRLHLTGAKVDGMKVELLGKDAERAVESLQYLLAGLSPEQRAKISIVNSPDPVAAKAAAGGCFIATAACGSPDAGEVRDLRDWRDAVLRPSPLGRRLVRCYEVASPPAARWIETRPATGRLVRILLIRPIAALARACLHAQRP